MTLATSTRRIVVRALFVLFGFAGASAIAATPAPELVLVVGATGRTGVHVVEQLVTRGRRVRAFVRSADKARATLPAGVEIAVGDVRDPATIAPAMRGVTHVVSAIGGGARNAAVGNGPADVDRDGNIHLVEAAQRAGVAHFVLVSSGGIEQADTYPAEFMRPVLAAKRDSEQYLRTSGLPYTIVRPGGLGGEPRAHTRIVLRQEPGAPFGRVSREEVAQVCIAALGSAAARGKTFEVLAEDGDPVADLEPLFAALRADTPANGR
ncbi:MAG: SDR family oxidoreductase [Steroidobacteraceae bacterium]